MLALALLLTFQLSVHAEQAPLTSEVPALCTTQLTRAGLIRWKSVNVGALFKELSAVGIPLTPFGLRANDAKVRQVTTHFLGKNVGPYAIISGVEKNFGEWNEVVKNLGFDNSLHRNYLEEVSAEKLIEALKLLDKNGVALSSNAIRSDSSESTRRLIQSATGLALTGKALHHRVLAQLGPWPKALARAGVNVVTTVARASSADDLTQDQVLAIIRHLAANIDDLTRTSLLEQKSRVRQLMFDQFGIPLMPEKIMALGAANWGTWLEALEAADVDNVETVQRASRMNWSAEKVVEVIQFVKKNCRRIDHIQLRLESAKCQQLVFAQFRRPITGRTLLNAASVYHGSWFLALKAAGLKAKGVKIAVRGQSVAWNGDLVLNIIRFLAQKRVNLHWANFLLRNADVLDLTYSEFHRPLTAHSIIVAAQHFFGTWSAAIAAAGVPWSMSERVDDQVGAVPTGQAAWQTNGVDDWSGTSLMVIDQGLSPEAALLRQEATSSLDDALDAADASDRELALSILDYLADHDNLDNHRSVLGYLRTGLNRELTWAVVENSLKNLSRYFELEPAD